MSISVEEIAREFIRYGSKRLGIEDRLNRFIAYIKSRGTKCTESDVIFHYVDSIFMPILQNSEQLAVAVSNRDVSRYYRNRFSRALSTRDKGFIRWFLKNYVLNYTDVDAVVSQNYALLPGFFGYCFAFCPVTGGTCASNANAVCLSATVLPRTGQCCTGARVAFCNRNFNMVDNAPWVSSYSTGDFGINTQVPQSVGTFTLTGSFTGPGCFPSSGVTLDLDLDVNMGSNYALGVTCASSCPSGTVCLSQSVPHCPSSSYSSVEAPVLYYSVGLTVLPNTSYSVWWSVSVS